jgi:hypothetical protein
MTYNKSHYLRNVKNDCICGGSFTNKNKSVHIKTNKHLNFINIFIKKDSIQYHQ